MQQLLLEVQETPTPMKQEFDDENSSDKEPVAEQRFLIYLRSSIECSKTANRCTTEKYRLPPTSSKFFMEIHAWVTKFLAHAGVYQYYSKFTNRSTTRVLIVTVVGAADSY